MYYTKKTIESIYNNLNNTINNAHNEMIMLKTKREYKTNWWSKELGDIKRSILAIKKKFKLRKGVLRENDDYCSELKDLKREFRKCY
jgi:tRNA(Met) C34 N-acetyltransferase TmcA